MRPLFSSLVHAMTEEIDYANNPLHGLSLKEMLTQIVEHYGYEVLYAYLNIKCFNNKPNIDSSVKFLKKTNWAREKVEAFYLYQYKSLPRASAEQFELPPRDRIIPSDQKPGDPAVLSLEDAERLREKRAERAARFDADRSRGGQRTGGGRSGSGEQPRSGGRSPSAPLPADADPWAKWRK